MRRHKIATALGGLLLAGTISNGIPARPTTPTASGHLTSATAATRSPAPVTVATPAATPGRSSRAAAPSRSSGHSATGRLLIVHGVAEPDRHLTPGSLLASSTKARICTPGYTRTIRYVSTANRRAVFTAYGISYPPTPGTYELDHLIPLELGGGNTPSNLWPQHYHGAGSADVKDRLENHLHALVCSGQLGLPVAQRSIAGDWYAAAAKYNKLTATARPAQPALQRSISRTPATSAGNGATAKCNDGSYSYAAHHRGACSRHGGVRQFYK